MVEGSVRRNPRRLDPSGREGHKHATDHRSGGAIAVLSPSPSMYCEHKQEGQGIVDDGNDELAAGYCRKSIDAELRARDPNYCPLAAAHVCAASSDHSRISGPADCKQRQAPQYRCNGIVHPRKKTVVRATRECCDGAREQGRRPVRSVLRQAPAAHPNSEHNAQCAQRVVSH